jgi:heme-degrading monooxygenase HmoA
MPLVSITRLRVRSFRHLPVFAIQAFRSARQAKNAPGNLAVSLLNDSHLTFWTRTLWNAEAAMRAFMVAGAHRHVMPHLLQWCDEAAMVHWVQDSPEPPSWQEAYRRLQQDGRASRVNHPSAAQLAFQIPPPNTRRQLTLK